MLVISRNPKESIMIGDDIQIDILSIKTHYIYVRMCSAEDISTHNIETKLIKKHKIKVKTWGNQTRKSHVNFIQTFPVQIGQTLLLADNIKLTLLGLDHNGKINIGFNAPLNIEIQRTEIYKKNQLKIANQQQQYCKNYNTSLAPAS